MFMLKIYLKFRNEFENLIKEQKGEGITGLVITVAAVLVIGGLIFIPQLKTLSTTIMTRISNFWTELSNTIFTV